MSPKGKWAQGIKPRHFSWVIEGRWAVCERPGGYGVNHRRVRRQEEIIWIREQGFTRVLSLIPSPHNLHNYDELGVAWQHWPLVAGESHRDFLGRLYPSLAGLIADGEKILLHHEELGDRVSGVIAGYLLWGGLVPSGPQAIAITERLVGRQLGPVGRELVRAAESMPPHTRS